jgi:hypothetical protein
MDPQEITERHYETWRKREQYEPHFGCAMVLDELKCPLDMLAVPAPLERGLEVAQAFESTPNMADDATVQYAFRQLVHQTDYWWKILTDVCRIKVIETDDLEPYQTAAEQCKDMVSGRLVISYRLANDHPLLTDEEYWRFRAVHDAYGHAGIGRGFDRHGEFHAWLVHTLMFRGHGCWAMSSEYRGVNSSLVYGDNAGTGKAVLLPAEVVQPEIHGPHV